MIVSVVIPCFNVARHIEQVVAKLPEEVNYIIAVNDASQDETEVVLQRLCLTEKRLICLKHDINEGVGGAMLTGFHKAMEYNSDVVIKMDGDNQMDSAYIPQLLQPIIENKADFTKGNRFYDLKALRNMPVGRRIGNLGLSFCLKAASGYWNVFDPANGYFAIRGDTLRSIDFKKIHKRYFFESSLLIELYFANAVVRDVTMKARYGDEVSGLSVSKVLFEFPPKLFMAFVRRIVLKYFLFDFNIGSLYLLTGVPLMLAGLIYGIVKFVEYASEDIPAPTGTVVIPTLFIVLGFQLILSAINYDISNYPKK